MDSQNRSALGPDLKAMWDKIPGYIKLSFLSACILGAITHTYAATNFLLNNDSVSNIFTDNDVITTGRWALRFFSAASTAFQLPVVGVVITIIALALSAVLTVEVLEIRSHLGILAVSGFMVTFPVVACIFAYMYTADAYFLALLLNALAVWLAKRYRWPGSAAAALLMATACGIYQAFICYAVGLMLLDCIVGLFDNQALKDVICRGLRYMWTILLSLILYYVILQVILDIRDVELSDYKGINMIGSTGISTYLQAVPRAFKQFLEYFWTSAYISGPWLWLQRLMILLSGLFTAVIWLKNGHYRDMGRTALLLLGFLLVPLALNFITILAANVVAHELERYAFVLLPILGIKLLELLVRQWQKRNARCATVSVLLAILLFGALIWNNFCISNVIYLRLQLCYENTYAIANRVVTHMELHEDYDPGMPVVFMGIPDRNAYITSYQQFRQYDSLTGANHSTLVYEYALRRFIPDCLGGAFVPADEETIAYLEGADWVAEMPSYPEKGFIQVHNGILVVKLGSGGALHWAL